MTSPLYGKYRGTVVNNVDPEMIGRIQAIVPAVSPIPSTWALPCLPWGGINQGLFTVPLVGAGVWIEYEGGNPDYPIWTGCYWGSTAELPAMSKIVPPGVPGITLQTALTNGLVISDVPGPTGGILLKTVSGAMISISEVGITISNGQGAIINLAGPTVTVNAGALTVT